MDNLLMDKSNDSQNAFVIKIMIVFESFIFYFSELFFLLHLRYFYVILSRIEQCNISLFFISRIYSVLFLSIVFVRMEQSRDANEIKRSGSARDARYI